MTARDPLGKYNVRLNKMIRSKFPNQYAFAKFIKVDNSFLSNVLLYRKTLKEEQLEKWATALNVPKEAILETLNK